MDAEARARMLEAFGQDFGEAPKSLMQVFFAAVEAGQHLQDDNFEEPWQRAILSDIHKWRGEMMAVAIQKALQIAHLDAETPEEFGMKVAQDLQAFEQFGKERHAVFRLREQAIERLPHKLAAALKQMAFSLSEGVLKIEPDPALSVEEQTHNFVAVLAGKDDIARAFPLAASQLGIEIDRIVLDNPILGSSYTLYPEASPGFDKLAETFRDEIAKLDPELAEIAPGTIFSLSGSVLAISFDRGYFSAEGLADATVIFGRYKEQIENVLLDLAPLYDIQFVGYCSPVGTFAEVFGGSEVSIAEMLKQMEFRFRGKTIVGRAPAFDSDDLVRDWVKRVTSHRIEMASCIRSTVRQTFGEDVEAIEVEFAIGDGPAVMQL